MSESEVKSPVNSKGLTILLPCIDAIKEKNLYQIRSFLAKGYRFIILTSDSTENSRQVVESLDGVELHIAEKKWRRTWYVLKLIRILLKNRIDIAEIYPDHPLEFILSAILKIARVPLIIIARGAEYEYVTSRMSRIRKIAFRFTYALADFVVYKELYMKDMLLKMGKRDFCLIPNSVSIPQKTNIHSKKKCCFLFLNTIKSFRHPEIALKAFIEICREMNLDASSEIRLLIVGLQGERMSAEVAAKEDALKELVKGKDVPVEFHPWANKPKKWLDEADVFLLPADIVFLNYSLLEAMALGIPPIIQQTEGSELIVTEGLEGYALPPDEKVWKDHMIKLIEDEGLRKRMGMASREKVKKAYSLESYILKYEAVYRDLLEKCSCGQIGFNKGETELNNQKLS